MKNLIIFTPLVFDILPYHLLISMFAYGAHKIPITPKPHLLFYQKLLSDILLDRLYGT